MKHEKREADRERFPDDAFNEWLDQGISDCGHTVWDSIVSVESAWLAWSAAKYDGHLQDELDRQYQAAMELQLAEHQEAEFSVYLKAVAKEHYWNGDGVHELIEREIKANGKR